MKEPDSRPSAYDAFRGTERRLHERLLWPAVSLAFHLVVLVVISIIQFREPSPVERVTSEPHFLRIAHSPDTYEDIAGADVPVDASSADVPSPQQEERTPALAPLTVPSRSGPGIPATGAGPGASVSTTAPSEGAGSSLERLRYRMPTSEVWRRSDPPQPSAEEVVRARVASRLDAYNDSIAAEAAASGRATDWTVKDADGGRWGVTPGKIHLGSLTLPLPFTFSTPPGRREEVAGRLANWTAIQQQATIVEGREIMKDRIKAIEQRKAAERAARQNRATTPPPGGTSGGSGGTSGSSGGGSAPRGGS